MLAAARAQFRAPAARLERVRCNLTPEAVAKFSGDSGDFFILLPEHVSLRAGAELNLMFHPSTELWPALAAIDVSVNDRKLPARVEGKDKLNTNAAIQLRAELPEGSLHAGWNKVSLQLRRADPELRKPCDWYVRGSESYLEISFERMPLFSELARFPRSMMEEKLLHPGSPSATVAILLPLQNRDVHLRACAILGARFGQLGYLSDGDCRLGALEHWEKESAARNGVVVARVDELMEWPILKSFSANVAGLNPGQGMLIEVILGKLPAQRRWIFAIGADDAGLEKAILTLGSAPAMASLPPSPVTIEAEPVLPSIVESGSHSNSVQAAKIRDLQQLNQLMVRDCLLRKAAFLLPAGSSIEEMQTLLNLASHLGKQTPGSPVLWPEACSYSATAAPIASRLQERSVLLLGAVNQWKNAFPSNSRLPIEMPPGQSNVVRMNGRTYKLAGFEPSLALIQLLPSPWSGDETVVAAGGWHNFSTPTLERMLTEAAASGKLFGNLAAMDAAGRIAAYDTRKISPECFAERVHRQIPLGLSVEETSRRLSADEVRSRRTARLNNLILYFAAGLLLFLVLCRIALHWDQERRRKKSLREENQAGSTP